MSQNKFIHPRNIYKTAPDYTDLAVIYPEFRKLCKLNLDGTVRIDLRDEKALIALSRSLLQKDFGLDVQFAPKSLIPTIPLRLNYLLWIEDIVIALELKNVRGIDIGCGSSCIYSLLAAKKFQWSMAALEYNEENIKFASDNVDRNGLSDLVKVFPQTDNSVIFEKLLEESTEVYDFCLCNPPFFDRACKEKNRSGSRKRPKNCPTGNEDELFCDGGEVAFVKKIVDESCRFQDRIRVFTTMLGHKTSVAEIVSYLKTLNVGNCIQTSFCQGNTTRWGLAWTFVEGFDLQKVTCINSS